MDGTKETLCITDWLQKYRLLNFQTHSCNYLKDETASRCDQCIVTSLNKISM